MNQKQLLKFMKRKIRESPEEVVIFRDGKYLTLQQVRNVVVIGRKVWDLFFSCP
jgi:hypothetical protein